VEHHLFPLASVCEEGAVSSFPWAG
jgi:hypothetical protein